MRRQSLERPVIAADVDTAQPLDRLGEHLQQRAGARLDVGQQGRGGVGDRHERCAKRLGQGAKQSDNQFLSEGGYEPIEVLACTDPSDASGMWTVTPAAAEPGSERYDSANSNEPCLQRDGRPPPSGAMSSSIRTSIG